MQGASQGAQRKRRLRLAAVGDIHVSESARGALRPLFADIESRADVLLIAGDLTHYGKREQAEVLAGELEGLPLPVVAVLGNHDHHCGEADAIRAILCRVGVTMLEGESVVLEIGGCTLGIAGSKGFGGGFEGACGHKFGEPEMKAFVQASDDSARIFEARLAALQTDYRVALLHYAPVPDTLEGERLEIFPWLGAYQFGRALDRAGADLAIHGHAHYGRFRGATACGIPVRNVAAPVIRRPYAVLTLGEALEDDA